MDTDAKGDATLGKLLGLKPGDFALQVGSTAKGIQGALEYCDETIASILDDLASATDQGGIYNADTKSPITPMRLDLRNLHKPGVTDHVSHEDSPKRPFKLCYGDRNYRGIRVLLGRINQPHITVISGIRRPWGSA